jgi:methylenetetrahydrofolate dehydrogenase (NADP+)/methenyltetrahydrofolate cyclohydrolase
MSAIVIDGKKIAIEIKNNISKDIKKSGRKLGLGTILVGDDPGSKAYVDGKHRDCEEVGISSIKINLPSTATEAEIINEVERLNNDSNCTGFIVQLPLPESVNTNNVLSKINPKKDADGLHPLNLGNLVLSNNSVIPCTPRAILEIFERYEINLSGSNLLIIGRGNTVGRPLSILLSQKPLDATVTLAHSKSKNLESLMKNADILIAALGISHFVKPNMIKPGAVVIDVGITRSANGLLGDVDPSVTEVASYFTPMPGGVGPLTRAMLLANLVELSSI